MTSPSDPGKRIDYTRPGDGGAPEPGPFTGSPAAGAPAPPAKKPGIGLATYAITILAFILIIIVVVFITQNTQSIRIKFFSSSHYASVAGALAGSAGVGLVVGLLLGFVPQIRIRRELRQYRRGKR